MLKKTITYENWDGVEVTETHYFNLSKSELIFWESEEEGGLKEKLQRIIDAKDQREIMKFVQLLLRKSYGEKSPDGKYFRKSEEISDNFVSTRAFDALVEELLLGEGADQRVADFVAAVLPKA